MSPKSPTYIRNKISSVPDLPWISLYNIKIYESVFYPIWFITSKMLRQNHLDFH